MHSLMIVRFIRFFKRCLKVSPTSDFQSFIIIINEQSSQFKFVSYDLFAKKSDADDITDRKPENESIPDSLVRPFLPCSGVARKPEPQSTIGPTGERKIQ